MYHVPKLTFLEKVRKFAERIPASVKVEGVDALLRKIQETRSAEQQRDYLAPVILASLFSGCASKLVFEESCDQHPSKGPHDLVVYLSDGSRIVNEIRRLKQTAWDQWEEKNCLLSSVRKTDGFYMLREDPDRTTTGFLDTILSEVESKERQLDPYGTNVIWLTSRANHYEADDVQVAASHYAKRWKKLPADQLDHTHKKPQWLTALGWFWDGDPECTSARPECYIVSPSRAIDQLGSTVFLKTCFE